MAGTNTVATGGSSVTDVSSMNLWQKLAAITGEVGVIAKDGTNSEQKYKFIEYAAVAGRLRELFAKYRVVVIPSLGAREVVEITSSYGKKGVAVTIHFTFTFRNADKPDETEVIPWVGEAADYGDKATNKAATAALKYCLMRTFNVSEKGDEDPDSTTIDRGEQKPEAPKKLTIQDAIAQASAELTRKGFMDAEVRKQLVLRIAGIESMQDLKATHMNRVLEVLANNTGKEIRGYLDAEKQEEAADTGQAEIATQTLDRMAEDADPDA